MQCDGVIVVHGGVYDEQLSINRPMAIIGAGKEGSKVYCIDIIFFVMQADNKREKTFFRLVIFSLTFIILKHCNKFSSHHSLLSECLEKAIYPFTPGSDQYAISPYIINTLSTRLVMRIKKSSTR